MSNDRLPAEKPDAIYLFGNTTDNELGILKAAQRLLDIYSTGSRNIPFFLCGGSSYRQPSGDAKTPVAYSGFQTWCDWLIENAYLDEEDIHAVLRAELAHTGTEAENLITIAVQQGWSTLVVVAAHMHMLRAFTNTLTFATRLAPTLRVYAASSIPPERWTQEVLSSQGVVHGSILGTGFAAEWERLNKWHAKGDLISAREVLAYIEWRDHE